MWARDCECGAAGFGHEPGCPARVHDTADHHLEQRLDITYEESLP